MCSKDYALHYPMHELFYPSLISSYQIQEGACSVSSFGASSLEESLFLEHDQPIQAIQEIVLFVLI